MHQGYFFKYFLNWRIIYIRIKREMYLKEVKQQNKNKNHKFTQEEM